MNSKLNCPEDIQLWPTVLDGTIDPEIQRHLNECAVCQQRLKSLREVVQAVREVEWSPPAEEESPPVAVPLPESIGEYPILARLGSGGQADVYRAWHPRLKTDVVIKWFREDAFAGADTSQLAALAQILSTIRNPNLGQIYDVGTQQGRPFMIMEYIKGALFSTWVRKCEPTIPQIAAALSKAARAVDAVHKQGALHLDLKPANIMIDDEGEPRVIDFGMAQLQGHGDHRSILLAPGTPEYMSPEQYAGHISQISVASDVYGLGAVLYSALCDHPIRSSDQMSLEPDWERIGHAPWRVRRICHRALAIRPQDRYESALALADELQRFAERHTRMRRAMAAAIIVLGTGSCLWGVLASIQHSPNANLVIEHQRSLKTPDRTVYEIQCTAVLSDRRLPCLMIATATSAPASVNKLMEETDSDWRIARLRNPDSWIQVADNAGPHLVLACAKREWPATSPSLLTSLLQSLHSHRLNTQLEVLVNHDFVQVIPAAERSFTPRELEQIQSIVGIAEQIRVLLNQKLPCYSGIVVIPASTLMIAHHQ